MSNGYASLADEREDLEKTVACLKRIGERVRAMADRRRESAVQIELISEQIRRMGAHGGSSRAASRAGGGNAALDARIKGWEESVVARSAARKKLCQAVSDLAQKVSGWAKDLEGREKEQNSMPDPRQGSPEGQGQPEAHAQTLPTPYPLVPVPGIPSDAVSFQYNGLSIRVPPNTDFAAVYEAGVANGPLNVAGINAYVGHFGTFDFQRNQGLGWAGQSSSVNYLYPAYTDASNFAVGVFMAGAGFSWSAIYEIAHSFAILESGGKISPDAVSMWQEGWNYGQSIKASRTLRPVQLDPTGADPILPLEQFQ